MRKLLRQLVRLQDLLGEHQGRRHDRCPAPRPRRGKWGSRGRPSSPRARWSSISSAAAAGSDGASPKPGSASTGDACATAWPPSSARARADGWHRRDFRATGHMILYVIRHGIAEERAPAEDDGARRLTPRGRQRYAGRPRGCARSASASTSFSRVPCARRRDPPRSWRKSTAASPCRGSCRRWAQGAPPAETVRALQPFLSPWACRDRRPRARAERGGGTPRDRLLRTAWHCRSRRVVSLRSSSGDAHRGRTRSSAGSLPPPPPADRARGPEACCCRACNIPAKM